MKENSTKKQKKKETYKYKDFGKRMGDTMRMKGITNRMLGNYICLSESAVSGSRTGRRSPSVTALAKISDYLQVSADYLLGNTDDSSTSSPTPVTKTSSKQKKQ